MSAMIEIVDLLREYGAMLIAERDEQKTADVPKAGRPDTSAASDTQAVEPERNDILHTDTESCKSSA